ncbi:hypothetical protein [Streptomyces sp. A5-4]|uniref:hypothetical protein n=1 Tax=Streptomyces sp. A5-4 TaxID=3384771 RepID=UPI003DA8E316
MHVIPEESQIHESAQGPRATPAAGGPASTPSPVPGPRTAATPRPGRPVPGPPKPRPVPAPAPAPPPVPAPVPPAQPAAAVVPETRIVPVLASGALDAADEAVDQLLDSGRAPGDILVLTTGERHPWAAHELSFGEASYWAQHDARDDVFYADASAAERAATRPVVIVAVNGEAGDAVTRALPVARDRAGALLIVCGEQEKVDAVLGAGV